MYLKRLSLCGDEIGVLALEHRVLPGGDRGGVGHQLQLGRRREVRGGRALGPGVARRPSLEGRQI